MKKIYTLLSAAALYVSVLVGMTAQVSAQFQLIPEASQGSLHSTLTHRFACNRPADNARTSSVSGNWLDYWFVEDSIAVINGYSSSNYSEYLFPDSSVLACNVTCGNPWIHLIGNVLDPNSADMQNILGYSWNNTNPYSVDSLAINFFYERQSGADVVDTLIAYLWDNAVASDIHVKAYFGPAVAHYGVDTLKMALMPYDSTGTNMPNTSPGALQTFKILLTVSDTASISSNNPNIKVINTNNFSVPAGKLVASAFAFKPGYSYSNGETITSTENDFAFLSVAPNGAGFYPPYSKGDFNLSSVVTNGPRYNIDRNGWDGFFIPTYAWALGFGFQEHLIDYYVTGTFDAGINESISTEGVKLYQNQPNPANRTTLIKYDTKTVGAASLEVTDLTGRIVMGMNQGNQPAGTHSFNLDVSGLSQGMYLYTLRTTSESLTRRMIISE